MTLFGLGPALVAAAVLAPAAAASALGTPPEQGQFRTPSGYIGCAYARDFLRCDVDGGVVPLPPRERGCDVDWGGGFEMRGKGPASVLCAGDTARSNAAPVLRYGATWRRGSITCASYPKGLHCTNASLHGFFLSKGRAYRF